MFVFKAVATPEQQTLESIHDRRQECVVAWLKIVFSNLSDVELSTVKGKLTIYDTKGKISIQKSIPDYLRFLKE